MPDKNLEMAERIAVRTAEAGGRAYFVGGFVRDRLLGIDGKDIDIEVHGLMPEALHALLASLGDVMTYGSSFGIYALRGYDLDIAMPRTEQATGRGHRDFSVYVDPMIGTLAAARRRDFTINALMQDVLTGQIIDHFGGRADLSAGILRHVSDESFAEDPLRVLRGAQFAARFGFRIAPETLALCRTVDLSALSRERVALEMDKAFDKSQRPSVFFEVLRRMGQLHCWFGELEALIDVPQPANFHPEGDVWNHTLQVLDAAAEYRDRAEYPRRLLYAALCHDMGKAVTTQERGGKLHAYGHEVKGLPIVRTFLRRLTDDTALTRYVLNMTELHMKPNMLAGSHAGKKSFMHLFDDALVPGDLLLLARADHMGRCAVPEDRRHLAESYVPLAETLTEMYTAYQDLMLLPQVQGRDLIAAGVQPGPLYKDALAYAHKLHLAGVPYASALRQTLTWLHKAAAKET